MAASPENCDKVTFLGGEKKVSLLLIYHGKLLSGLHNPLCFYCLKINQFYPKFLVYWG